MNTGKILNSLIAIVSFSLFLAATLPVFNNPDMNAFQAFILTPALMMVAALGAAVLYHCLDWTLARLHQAANRPSDYVARGNTKGSGPCLPAGRAVQRLGTDTNQAAENSGGGRWAA
ncbi:MAG: hypothetical protein OQK99_01615 [Gammaproteobacteria bacterium]|jgi:hypothetical protein|nr:hypothetical protein [Gammaproteobacteria bacterium]